MAKRKGQAGGKSKGKPTRYQRQQKFWLNGRDKEENELANYCDGLREQRRFTTVVRNGLVLMRALGQGDTQTLFRMFPNLYESLYAQMEADVLLRRDDEAISRLGRVEELILNLNLATSVSVPQLGAGEGGGIKTIEVPKFEIPDDDDDDLFKVVAAKVDGDAIAQNFLRSLGAITGKGVSEARP